MKALGAKFRSSPTWRSVRYPTDADSIYQIPRNLKESGLDDYS